MSTLLVADLRSLFSYACTKPTESASINNDMEGVLKRFQCDDSVEVLAAMLATQLRRFYALEFCRESGPRPAGSGPTLAILAVTSSTVKWVIRPNVHYSLGEIYAALKLFENIARDIIDTDKRTPVELLTETALELIGHPGSVTSLRKIMFLSHLALDAAFVSDEARFQKALQELSVKGIRVSITGLLPVDKCIQQAVANLHALKARLPPEGISATLSRLTEASMGKLIGTAFANVQRRASLSFNNDPEKIGSIVLAMDVAPAVEIPRAPRAVQFCSCHGKEVSRSRATPKEAVYCSTSNKRLDAQRVFAGLAISHAAVYASNQAQPPPAALPEDSEAEFCVLAKLNVASLSLSLLYGSPFYATPSRDLDMELPELSLHRASFQALLEKMSVGKFCLLLASSSNVLEAQNVPCDPLTRFYIMCADDTYTFAVIKPVASREQCRGRTDDKLRQTHGLPTQIEHRLTESLHALGPAVDYNPLDYTCGLQTRIDQMVSMGRDISEFVPVPLEPAAKAKKKPTKTTAGSKKLTSLKLAH